MAERYDFEVDVDVVRLVGGVETPQPTQTYTIEKISSETYAKSEAIGYYCRDHRVPTEPIVSITATIKSSTLIQPSIKEYHRVHVEYTKENGAKCEEIFMYDTSYYSEEQAKDLAIEDFRGGLFTPDNVSWNYLKIAKVETVNRPEW